MDHKIYMQSGIISFFLMILLVTKKNKGDNFVNK